MQVSSLFSRKKLESEIEAAKRYGDMVGIGAEDLSVTLVNDIGGPGELFDKSQFDVLTKSIEIEEDKHVNVAYIPKFISTIIYKPGVYVSIDECYIQPRYPLEIGVSDMPYSLESVNILHVSSSLTEFYRLRNTMVNRLVVHADNGRAEFIYKKAMGMVNEVEYDRNTKYIEFYGQIIVEVRSSLYKRLKHELGEVELHGDLVIEVRNDGKWLSIVDSLHIDTFLSNDLVDLSKRKNGGYRGLIKIDDLKKSTVRNIYKEFIRKRHSAEKMPYISVPYYSIYYDDVFGFKRSYGTYEN